MKPSYLRFIIGLLVLSCIAWRQMPQLEPYQHQNITLNIPQGWQVTKDNEAGTITISPDPEREDAPSIGIIVFDYIENANAEQIMASILPELQKQALEFNIIETYNIAEGGQGKIILADYAEEINGQAVAGRMVLMIDVKQQDNLIALTSFSAKNADFNSLDGLNLTTAVTGSIKRVEANPLTNANQPSTNQNTSIPQGSLPTLNKQPQLVPYQDSNISAQIPEGWSVDVNPNDGTLTLKEHPTNPDSPVILLGVTQSNLSSSINSTILIDWIKQMLGNQSLHIVEEKPLTAGKIIVVDFDDFPIRVAALIEVDPQGFTTLAMLAASQEGFSSLGGINLLTSISQSARPTSVTSTAPTTSTQNTSSPPNLIPYQDEFFSLQVPQGWQVASDVEKGSINIAKDPSNKLAPTISIQFAPYQTPDTLSKAFIDTLGSAGNSLEVLSEQEIAGGQGRLLVLGASSLPIRIAVLVIANAELEFSLVAYLQSLTEEFEVLGGASLLKTVAENTQIRLDEQDSNSTGTGNVSEGKLLASVCCAPSFSGDGSVPSTESSGRFIKDTIGQGKVSGTGAPVSNNVLAGAWTVSEFDYSYDASDFVFSGGGSNSKGFKYAFTADGRYTLDYSASVTFGVQNSRTQVTETGQYTLNGSNLHLSPQGLTGWIYTGVSTNKAYWDGRENELEPRSYQVRYFPEQDMLVLSGQECQMYRVDSYCGEVYDFPFKRSK